MFREDAQVCSAVHSLQFTVTGILETSLLPADAI